MVLILIKEKKGAPEGEDEVTESEVPRYYFNCLPVQVEGERRSVLILSMDLFRIPQKFTFVQKLNYQ